MSIFSEAAFQKYVFIRDRALPPFIATLFGVFLILLCDRRPPLEVNGLTISPTPVHAGAPAYAIYSALNKRDCEGEVRRTIIDSAQHAFTLAPEPSIYPAILDATKRQFVKTFTVPLGSTAGPATYRADVYRWCNWPQRVFWKFHDQYETPFIIGR